MPTPKLSLTTGALNPQPATAPRRLYRARFIRAGRALSSDGAPTDIEITPTALQSASQAGLFDSRAVFVDHASLWENPSVDNLIGVTQSSSYDPLTQTVNGEISLYTTPAAQAIASLLDEILAEPNPPDIGLSLVFYPVWSPLPPSPMGGDGGGSDFRQITAIRKIESIDLVFQPAADGRILAALSSFNLQPPSNPFNPCNNPLTASPDRNPFNPCNNPLTASPDRNPFNPCSNPLTASPDRNPFNPCNNPLTASPDRNPLNPCSNPLTASVDSRSQEPPMPEPESPITDPETPNPFNPFSQSDDSSPVYSPPDPHAWLTAMAASASRVLIASSGLPSASQERLLAQFCRRGGSGSFDPPTSPTQVEQAIDAERAYLAALQESNVIQIGGQPPRGGAVTGMRTGLDQLTEALEALLHGIRPASAVPLSGIREFYHLISGDYEMSGMFQPERVQFANVTSATMSALVANALNKMLVNEFQQYPQWWSPIVQIDDFTNLQDVRWITLGGVGELPTVAEGAAYTELTWDDKTETASFVKKGGYLGLTIEAIDKDDTGRLRVAPRALAQAAWLTLSKAISNIFTSNSGAGPTVSDSTALFTSGHGNLLTTALSVSAYQAVRLAMRKQTELNSGERLGSLTAPKYLLVPPDLEITALQVLASENDYTYALSNAPAAPVNPLAEGDTFNARMQSARSRVIVVDLWTDTNDWAAIADPRLYPTIGLGFRYGRSPEIFSVASPTAGLMFTNDTMPIKARFFFAVGPMDWKGLHKSNVA